MTDHSVRSEPRLDTESEPVGSRSGERSAAAGSPLRIAICITTFRRPEGLRRLLASLDTLTFTRMPRPEMTVFVIDNDSDRPLRDTHPGLESWTRLPLDYRVESRRGLAHARNAALDAVVPTFDALAFIDDDEWAEPQWLDALLATHARSGAMVVQGPVRPQFTSPPEPWMTAVGFYEVGPFEDGAELDWGASGNCLIDKRKLDATGVRFDTSFNHSGGEDSDLFARLLRSGARIVAARDAVAWEAVPAERMTLAWATRRAYRLGHTLGRLASSTPGARPKLIRLGKTIARLGVGFLQVVPLGFFSGSTRSRGRINIAWSIGTLAAFLGREVSIYDKKA